MMKPNPNSMNLLGKYAILYKKNPRSRVFAPLAEAYRKIGLHKDAFKVLEKGLKFHPTYVLGYIVLAHCYFDSKQFELAYSTLRPFVGSHRDNLALIKLYSDICLEVGFFEEALENFKYILYLNPHDKYAAKQVKILEDDLLYKKQEVIEEQKIRSGTYEPSDPLFEEDSWVHLDLTHQHSSLEHPATSEINEVNEDDQNWEMNSPKFNQLEKFKNEVKNQDIKISKKNLDDDEYFSSPDYSYEDEGNRKNLASPFINHTLVDLFLNQNLEDKAIEVLENIIKLHPGDQKSIKRLAEIKNKNITASLQTQNDDSIKTNGHEKLLNLVESSVHFRKEKIQLENAFKQFNTHIKKLAQQKKIELANSFWGQGQ